MLKKLLLFTIVFVMIGVGCSSTAEPTEAPRVTLKLPFFPVVGLGPMFVAEDEGYFDEQNIDVEWVPIVSITEELPLLIEGSLDVAMGSPAAGFFNAIDKGLNLKIVAGLSQTGGPEDCSFAAVVVRKDLYDSGEVASVADWAGRKVALNGVGALPQYQMASMLDSEGLSFDDVDLVILSFQEIVAGLGAGAVDIALLAEPLVTQVVANEIAVPILPLNEAFPNQTGLFIIFGPNMLEENPELGERFMVAFLKGIRKEMEGKTESNLESMANHTKLPKELLSVACWDGRHPNAAVTLDALRETQEWFVKSELQDRIIEDNELFEGRYLDHAVEVLGEME